MHDISGKTGVFYTAEMDIAGGDEPWYPVTAARFPLVFECLQGMSHDAGFGANHDNFSISAKWVPELPAIEMALAQLDQDQRGTVAFGDQDEAEALIAANPGMDRASALFDDFFEE